MLKRRSICTSAIASPSISMLTSYESLSFPRPFFLTLASRLLSPLSTASEVTLHVHYLQLQKESFALCKNPLLSCFTSASYRRRSRQKAEYQCLSSISLRHQFVPYRVPTHLKQILVPPLPEISKQFTTSFVNHRKKLGSRYIHLPRGIHVISYVREFILSVTDKSFFGRTLFQDDYVVTY